jgi:FKBP-type peptidyl-prolyl cis-trans isomerase FkpA
MICKIHKRYSFYILCAVMVLIIRSAPSCSGNDTRDTENNRGSGVSKEELVRANQFLVGKDMELITAYVKRRNWDINFTETGLGYQVYVNGAGRVVTPGSLVTLDYTLSLLDGRVCYSSEKDGPRIFRIGQGGVEAGLEEGVRMLRAGDKARLILPPFLGHGLIGDQNRIPGRAVLIYEIEVKNVAESR